MSPISRLARGVICAGLITVLACEPDNAGPGGSTPDPDPDPSTLVIRQAPEDAGNGQEAFRGTALPRPLRVRVTRDGVPVAGVPVTWTPYLFPASGTVAGHGVTDADGIATATWTLGEAGALQVAAELENRSRITFQARSLPASLEILSGDQQQGVVGLPLPDPVRVRVTFGGVPLPGETIVVQNAGAYEVAGRTDAGGEATVHLTTRTVAGYQVYQFRTEADGPNATPRPVPAQVLPDAPAEVTWITLHGGVVDDSPGVARLLVRDQYGNPVPGTEVAWRFETGSGTFESAVTFVSGEGYASASYAMHSSAAARLGVTVGSMVELLSADFNAWDITYSCPIGCWLTPEEITRPAGYILRFAGGQDCWFTSAVPGPLEVVPSEFPLTTPGTYEFSCGRGYEALGWSLDGRIIVTP